MRGNKFHYYRHGRETIDTGKEEREDDKKTEKKTRKTKAGRLWAQRGPKRATSPAPRATKYGTRNYNY